MNENNAERILALEKKRERFLAWAKVEMGMGHINTAEEFYDRANEIEQEIKQLAD